MTGIDLAAIAGAAAWIPQIFGWVYRAAVRPKVVLIPLRTVEVGYTGLGPIVNVTAALTVERKDVIVDRVEMVLRHEHGREIRLTWARLNETFSQVRNPAGDVAEVSKNQPAVALKLSTLTTVEKLIGLHDLEFQQETRRLEEAVLEQAEFVRKSGADVLGEIAGKKEFRDMLDRFRRDFPWDAGKYDVEIRIHLLGAPEKRYKMGELRLSAMDVDRLQKNVEQIEKYNRDLVAPPATGQVALIWAWAYPGLENIAH